MKNKILTMETRRLLGLFLILDLLAVFLFLLYTQDILESRFFRLARDRGFAEIVQYLKFGVIIHLLIVWNRARDSRLLSAWILLFVIMLLDDSLGIHEGVGQVLMDHFRLPASLSISADIRTKDLFEAISFLALEGSACLYVAYEFIRAPRDLKRYSLALGLAMVPLVLCGLLLDLSHAHYLEQFGEMASMGLLLGCVHYHFMKYVRPRLSSSV